MLEAYGWSDRWAALLAEVPGDVAPARVVRHDGAGMVVATADGVRPVMLASRLDPEPTVGDWIAIDGDVPVAVLPRTSLLRRKAAMADEPQALAANLDLVLLVCGLDRPVKAGRLQRGAALAWDAGAAPVVVLTKAARNSADVDGALAAVADALPGVDAVVTSVREGIGVEELAAAVDGRTVALLGESGAGKSTIVNALHGDEVAATGDVRSGDSKGRHTTTTRQLHLLPRGGVLVDGPGIRSVGLWVDPEAVDAAFSDIDDLAAGCRFSDCLHGDEPGCAVQAAIAAGELAPARLAAWQTLRREAEAAELRATPHEQRRRDKRFARITKDAQRRKGR